MSISSSIFIGTTGVTAQQENMSVISDNIANMNTVGFKSSRLLFNSLLSEQLAGADVGHQVGQGVGVSSVFTDMASGAMEKTALATDIAVGGNGFFIVSPQNSDALFYTRAGNFTFDAQGYYRDPAGNIVQGYRLTDSGAAGSTLEDIRLDAPDGAHLSPGAGLRAQALCRVAPHLARGPGRVDPGGRGADGQAPPRPDGDGTDLA